MGIVMHGICIMLKSKSKKRKVLENRVWKLWAKKSLMIINVKLCRTHLEPKKAQTIKLMYKMTNELILPRYYLIDKVFWYTKTLLIYWCT